MELFLALLLKLVVGELLEITRGAFVAGFLGDCGSYSVVQADLWGIWHGL